MAGKPNTKATTPSFEELFRDLLRIKWPMAPDLPEPAKPAAPVARSCRLDHNTWHNPREGLRIAATIVPMLAVLLADVTKGFRVARTLNP